MFSLKHPVYTFHVRKVGEIEVLCIVDQFDATNPTATVTNMVELVLREIAQDLEKLPNLIVYRDSEGEWDRLEAKPSGEFQRFAPIVEGMKERVTEEDRAVQLIVTIATQPDEIVQ